MERTREEKKVREETRGGMVREKGKKRQEISENDWRLNVYGWDAAEEMYFCRKRGGDIGFFIVILWENNKRRGKLRI